MGTHYEGSAAEVLALDTYIKLVRAAESLVARVNRITDSGLTISQFGVLEALYHLGPLCQIDIGAKLLKSGGNVTMIIDNLEKRGLAERRRDQQDRRRVNVSLTPAGERLIREVFPRHVRAIASVLGSLTPEDQRELGRLCRMVGRSAAEAPDTDAAPEPEPARRGRANAQRRASR